MPESARDDFTWTELGERLRGWRVAAGLSQDAVAERAGLTQPGLYRIEAGQTNPQLDTLGRLARVFGRSIRELFCGSDLRSPQQHSLLNRVGRILSSGDKASIRVLQNGVVVAEEVLKANRNQFVRILRKVDGPIIKDQVLSAKAVEMAKKSFGASVHEPQAKEERKANRP